MRSTCAALALACTLASTAGASESIWVEAEHLRGVRGHCFPDVNGQTTKGHWAFSGPGICPEWSQGGESEWLSIACGPDETQAQAYADIVIPVEGEWRLWVRYRDWRAQSETFAVVLEQPGQATQQQAFGKDPVIDEEDELKLLWRWSFGWDQRVVKLAKGPARLRLLATEAQPGHRQVDCFCLTTDTSYRPRHREKPAHPTWALLDELRRTTQVGPRGLAAREMSHDPPATWRLGTFKDRGFLYLWNMGKPWLEELASSDPQRMLVPFHVDEPMLAEFKKRHGGKVDVPIFGDSRLVPTFHGPGPHVLDDPHFVRWLEANPDRLWANMMNYTTPSPLPDSARLHWPRFRDRYVGNINGEGLGVLAYDSDALKKRVSSARNREEVLQALSDIYLAGKDNTEKTIFGEGIPRAYETTIPCLSVEMTAHAHLGREWGARTVGFENTAVTPALGLRWAFLRGGARQYGGLTANYRSCNFGDAATIYGEKGYFYASPRFILDNWYDPFAGAGMTWYKFDIWHSYFAGCSMFYHEQGHDEFWQPGGQSAGLKPIQLSPKGILVDQFLTLTRKHPERGTPWTPIAFLLDQAHGWDPNAYVPTYFGQDVTLNPTVLPFDQHARMLKEWFKVAYHPYGPREAEINTGVNQTSIPSIFGNVFDVLVTSPTRFDLLSSYPVIVLNGEIKLSSDWGDRLAAYMENGGTLVACAEQLTGPGVEKLKLPKLAAGAEADEFTWQPTGRKVRSQRFRYFPIEEAGDTLANSPSGGSLAVTLQRGKGRLIFCSIPKGLGVDDSATPLVALLLAGVRQGLLPVEVTGEVEWLLNRTERGWIALLLNPAGANKPQHGLVPTDHSQAREVTLTWAAPVKRATEWFTQSSVPVHDGKVVKLEIPAGGVRIVELE
jgi:hypothetical protein